MSESGRHERVDAEPGDGGRVDGGRVDDERVDAEGGEPVGAGASPADPAESTTDSAAAGVVAAHAAAGAQRNGFTTWLEARFRNPAAIYGLLVFQAFIAIDSDDGDSVWEVLGTAVSTLIVFFIAHVFAQVLTEHGEHGLWRATWRAIQHASGMLYAAVPATLVMVTGALQGDSIQDVYAQTMIVTWVVLAVLGFAAYSRRGAHIATRIVGALGTAALGILIVLLEYAIH